MGWYLIEILLQSTVMTIRMQRKKIQSKEKSQAQIKGKRAQLHTF